MIYKVLIFAAATLITEDARAVPYASGQTWEQLIGELKDIEKMRHDAIVKVAEKPQFKADKHMVRYLAAWTEYDDFLIEIRKALNYNTRLLEAYEEDPPKDQNIDRPRALMHNAINMLSIVTERMESKMKMETKDVPAEFLLDKDFVTVLDALSAGSKKLEQIIVRMFAVGQ